MPNFNQNWKLTPARLPGLSSGWKSLFTLGKSSKTNQKQPKNTLSRIHFEHFWPTKFTSFSHLIPKNLWKIIKIHEILAKNGEEWGYPLFSPKNKCVLNDSELLF